MTKFLYLQISVCAYTTTQPQHVSLASNVTSDFVYTVDPHLFEPL